jgi:hypothetical protein
MRKSFPLYVFALLVATVAFSPLVTDSFLSAAGAGADHKPVCPGPAAFDTARCHARVVVDKNGNPKARGARLVMARRSSRPLMFCRRVRRETGRP